MMIGSRSTPPKILWLFLISLKRWKIDMDELEYKKFYDRVGKLNGWDFSKIKYISEGVKWNFYSEVTRRCKKSDILLDIGTGGGEFFYQ
jgi:hypothetical protein